jgi:hypothetical protein
MNDDDLLKMFLLSLETPDYQLSEGDLCITDEELAALLSNIVDDCDDLPITDRQDNVIYVNFGNEK